MFEKGDLIVLKDSRDDIPEWFLKLIDNENQLVHKYRNSYAYFFNDDISGTLGFISECVKIDSEMFYICYSQSLGGFLLCFEHELEKVETNA